MCKSRTFKRLDYVLVNKMKYRRCMSLLLILILSVSVFSSCSDVTTKDGLSKKTIKAEFGGEIRISSEYPDTFNPLKTQVQSNYNMLMLIFEGLFLVEEDETAIPVLALGYNISEDGLKYTISLKNDVVFHDGKPFSSKDVIYSMNNMKKYCDKYKSLFDVIDSFYAMGDKEVIIVLKEPSLNFVNNLDFPIVSELMPLSSFENQNETFIPVGTGEFKATDKLTRNEFLLTRNPNWHKNRGYVDSVKVSFSDNITTSMYSFNANLIDVITTNEFRWGDFSFTDNYKTHEYENDVYTFIGLNDENIILNSSNVKNALYSSANRSLMVSEVLNSHGVESYLPVATNSYYYPKDISYPKIDSDSVKTFLDNDGWVDIDSDNIFEKNISGEYVELSFDMIVNSDETNSSALAEIIRKSCLGYKMNINVILLSNEDYFKAKDEGKYDLYLGKMVMNASDALSFIPGNHSLALNEQLNKMKLVTNQDVFKDEFKTLCEIFISDMPHIPLFFETSAVFCKNAVGGMLTPARSNVYHGITNLFINTKEE